MTFINIMNRINDNSIGLNEIKDEIMKKDKMKRINYFAHVMEMRSEPLPEDELQELEAIVNILQVLYNSELGSPISDSVYDSLQETLISMGIPRLTGTIELNSLNKKSHTFQQLRGTLDKVYYLYPTEVRTNPSRKYLYEKLKSLQTIIDQKTSGIDLKKEKVMLTPKFDGVSAENENDGETSIWLLRGDTARNVASDVSHILRIFDKRFQADVLTGTKTEVVITYEKMAQLCELLKQSYTSPCRLVGAILNSTQADFRAEFLTVVPLRIIREGNLVEQIHPDLIRDFPTEVCTLEDLDKIKAFADKVRYLEVNGEHYPTDGVVMTFLNPKVKQILGRVNNVNRFEIAYKYSGEETYSRVKDIEFYVSQFGYIVPVLVVEDRIMKGRTVNHISLSNKERFDELGLCYGDEVKVHYEIIPYATIDEHCRKDPNHRKIKFVDRCPSCGAPLDLNQIEVQCTNPNCECKRVGQIWNYCEGVRIKNVGYKVLSQLYEAGFLPNGILSLYKLRKHVKDISLIPGFGIISSRKIIGEIESKRRLIDWQFFGSLGIEKISHAIFRSIFADIPHKEFLRMVYHKEWDKMRGRLIQINGVGEKKADIIVSYFKKAANRDSLEKLLKEVTIVDGEKYSFIGRIVFTGCRPTDELEKYLNDKGYEASGNWTNRASFLVVPYEGYTSNKTEAAIKHHIPVVQIDEIKKYIR